MDQLGIQLTVDSGKPPEERNLRLVDLRRCEVPAASP
jgi:hypothetical protein